MISFDWTSRLPISALFQAESVSTQRSVERGREVFCRDHGGLLGGHARSERQPESSDKICEELFGYRSLYDPLSDKAGSVEFRFGPLEPLIYIVGRQSRKDLRSGMLRSSVTS